MKSSDELKDNRGKPRKDVTNVDDYFEMIRSKRSKLALCEDANGDLNTDHATTSTDANHNNDIRHPRDDATS